MGALLVHVKELTPSDGWSSPSAVTFRKIFGKWNGKALWDAHRRYMVGYYESAKAGASFAVLQDILKLPDPNVMFVWNVFSADDETVALQDVFCALAVFSGAKLEEKGVYFHHMFDSHRHGSMTGNDCVRMLRAVADVFSKILGVPYKRKAFMETARETLQDLLPPLKLRVESAGASAFEEELISGADVEVLCDAFRPLYNRMPLTAMEEEPPAQLKGRLPVKPWPKEKDSWEESYAKKMDALGQLSNGRLTRNGHGLPKKPKDEPDTPLDTMSRSSSVRQSQISVSEPRDRLPPLDEPLPPRKDPPLPEVRKDPPPEVRKDPPRADPPAKVEKALVAKVAEPDVATLAAEKAELQAALEQARAEAAAARAQLEAQNAELLELRAAVKK